MTRRERLMRTLRGEAVDRPPVCFYEINGLDERPDDPDPFNIYADPSWGPLIDLAREKTDRIVMRGVAFDGVLPDPVGDLAETESFERDGSRFRVQRVRAEVEAESLRWMNEAHNMLTPDARASALRLKLVEKAEAIIRESVRPMEP